MKTLPFKTDKANAHDIADASRILLPTVRNYSSHSAALTSYLNDT